MSSALSYILKSSTKFACVIAYVPEIFVSTSLHTWKIINLNICVTQTTYFKLFKIVTLFLTKTYLWKAGGSSPIQGIEWVILFWRIRFSTNKLKNAQWTIRKAIKPYICTIMFSFFIIIDFVLYKKLRLQYHNHATAGTG